MADTPTETEQPQTSPAEAPETVRPKRPDLSKRALAALIDAVIAMVVGFVPLAGVSPPRRIGLSETDWISSSWTIGRSGRR